MKQPENSSNKFGILKFTRLAGIILGLIIVHFLTINANAQLVASRPGPYNSRINYGSSREAGLRAENDSYEDYRQRVSLYASAKRIRIDEEWHECYRHAQNAAQSKVCSDTSQHDRGDLEMDITKLNNAAYIEHQRRVYLITKYWNDRR